MQGQKIILRPAVPGDRRQIFEWLAHSDVTCKMIGPPEFADNPVPTWAEFLNDYTDNFFNDTNPDKGRSFIIETAGIAVGHINYNEIDRNEISVELDIWLRGRKYCHNGYGTDAINTLCKYLSEQLNTHTFILAPSARNKAAIRSYEKCGFKKVNTPLPNFLPDYYDTVIMLKSDSQ